MSSLEEITWKNIAYRKTSRKTAHLGSQLDKVLVSWAKSYAPLLDDRELVRLADEQFERIIVLVEGAKGHQVAVQVQGQPETTLLTTLCSHLPISFALLHVCNQLRILRHLEGTLPVEGAAHAGVCGHPREEVAAVLLLASNLARH